jgi:hypothetical protein
MDKRRLGTTGFEVTPIGPGTAQFSMAGSEDRNTPGMPGIDQNTAQSVVRAALDGGIERVRHRGDVRLGPGRTGAHHGAAPPGHRARKVVITTSWMPMLRPAASKPWTATKSHGGDERPLDRTAETTRAGFHAVGGDARRRQCDRTHTASRLGDQRDGAS